MNLIDVRALKAGDLLVANFSDEGLAGYTAGKSYEIESVLPVGKGENERWVTFTEGFGLSDYVVADHFSRAPRQTVLMKKARHLALEIHAFDVKCEANSYTAGMTDNQRDGLLALAYGTGIILSLAVIWRWLL